MESSGIVTFETPIGPCGIAWRGARIVGVAIGDTDEKEARYRLSEISRSLNQKAAGRGENGDFRVPERSVPKYVSTGTQTNRHLQPGMATFGTGSQGSEIDDPPAFVGETVEKIRALLNGGKPDFSTTPLALDNVPELNRRVYEIILELQPGETITYGAIARRLGDVSLSQAVGYALGKNPFPIVVPCHRVLGANGKVGGFSAAGGTATKLKLLNIERARTSSEPDLFGGLPLQERPQPDF